MRWTRLFDDLEAQLLAEHRAALRSEVAEHTRAHRGQLVLVDRLVADLGTRVVVRTRGGVEVTGTLEEVGTGWLVLDTGGEGPVPRRSVLVVTDALTGVSGLSGRADPRPGMAQRRLDLRHALRAVSRDRALVRLSDTEGGQLTGTIDRVGRDHVDLGDHAEDAPRRAHEVRRVVTVPFGALATLRRL